jgi:hypothetical protein
MHRRVSKRLAVVAGLAFSLASVGSAAAFLGLPDLDISPSVTPSVAPVVVAPTVANSFNIVDSFLLNSHNDHSSDFIDIANVGNIRDLLVSLDLSRLLLF